MRKRARASIALASVALLLAGCKESNGLMGPDNVDKILDGDGVQYAAVWHPCGTPGDRSEVELLADGKTWVVNKNADVSDSPSKKYPVKVRVDSKGRLEVLEFLHGAKAGEDDSATPEDEHRVATMKVSDPPMESIADKKPASCSSPSPTPSGRRQVSGTPSATPTPTPSVGAGLSASPKPAPTKSKTKKPSAGTGSGGSGGGGSKTCKTVNGKRICT